MRRQFGYSHVPAARAEQFNTYCAQYVNPFLNLHRPCLFGTEVPDLRKPERTRRIHRREDVMTPLEKLLSLSNAASFLRDGLTTDSMLRKARSMLPTSKLHV